MVVVEEEAAAGGDRVCVGHTHEGKPLLLQGLHGGILGRHE